MSDLVAIKNSSPLSTLAAVALGAAALAGAAFVAYSVLKPKPAKAAKTSTRPSPPGGFAGEAAQMLELLGYDGLSGLQDFREMYGTVRSQVEKVSLGGLGLLPEPGDGEGVQLQDIPALRRAVLVSSVLPDASTEEQWLSVVNSAQDFPDNSGHGKANLWEGVTVNSPEGQVAGEATRALLQLLGYEPGTYGSKFVPDYERLRAYAQARGEPDAFPQLQATISSQPFADAAVRVLVVSAAAMDSLPAEDKTFENAWKLVRGALSK